MAVGRGTVDGGGEVSSRFGSAGCSLLGGFTQPDSGMGKDHQPGPASHTPPAKPSETLAQVRPQALQPIPLPLPLLQPLRP